MKTLVAKNIRLVLPEDKPHMLLMDGDEILAEVHDHKLRRSIESGETDLKKSKVVEELIDH